MPSSDGDADHVDHVLAQWAATRPELDTAPAAVIERPKSAKMLWIGLGVGIPALLIAGFVLFSGVLRPGNRNIPAAGQYLNNLLVTDQTGIQGSWDFTFHFTPKVPAGIATTGENIPLLDALDKQLGLKL